MAFEPAIIVTRPSGQARRLIELLESGAQEKALPVRLVSLPLLTIVPKNDPDVQKKLLSSFATAKLIIFISPNAIECAMRAIADAGTSWQKLVQVHTLVGVVGGASKEALIRHGVDAKSIILPQSPHFDSEGLWSSLKNEVQDWKNLPVTLVKGDGGRESLIEHLKDAQASLETLSIYTRIPLDHSSPYWQSLAGRDVNHTLWLLTSSEAVRHLGIISQQQKELLSPSISKSFALCSHTNIATTAEQIGFTQVSVCDSGDESITQAALEWLAKQVKKSPSPTKGDH